MTEPEKKDESKRKLILELDLDALDKPIEKKKADVWERNEDITLEFNEMMQGLRYVMKYVATCLNDGPEVNENVFKRVIALRLLLDELLGNLEINGYLAYGVLFETLNNIYMEISGKQKTIQLLRRIYVRGEEKAKEKSKGYYV